VNQFTLANFQSCERFGKESFVFPKHCEQVFWSDAPELPGWRLVLRREIRGRRVDNFSSESERSLLFARGRDSDYEGLRPPQILSEDVQSRPGTEREVRREDVLGEAVMEDELFDRDLGDSSDSD